MSLGNPRNLASELAFLSKSNCFLEQGKVHSWSDLHTQSMPISSLRLSRSESQLRNAQALSITCQHSCLVSASFSTRNFFSFSVSPALPVRTVWGKYWKGQRKQVPSKARKGGRKSDRTGTHEELAYIGGRED